MVRVRALQSTTASSEHFSWKLDLSGEIWLYFFAKYSQWLSWCFGPHLCRGKGLYLGWGGGWLAAA